MQTVYSYVFIHRLCMYLYTNHVCVCIYMKTMYAYVMIHRSCMYM